MTEPIDILILGAGISGLTAARALAERNLRVCILEARHRVGGRILSQKVEGGGTVELGAEFIHGRAPELWALIDEVGCKTTEREGSMLREQPGQRLTDDPDDGALFEPLTQLESYTGPDQTFASWLATSNVPEDSRQALTGYVEGFNAADADRIGIHSLGAQQSAEDASEGDRSWHILGGYSQLTDHLAARVTELHGDIRLNTEVLAIRWSPQSVTVETSQGNFTAPRCLITLPLGVLQLVNTPDGLSITPEPQAIAHAHRLAMGHASRFTLLFRNRWWEASPLLPQKSLSNLSFLFTAARMPPVWWTSHPEREAHPALTGWAGGPRALALEPKSPHDLGAEACTTLAQIFTVDETEITSSLVATYTHDWANDPFFRGSYSYVPAGAMDAPAAMTQPEANTLYFAGEHTDTTANWGTVHAAIRTGLRAANQILNEPSAE
jgi:monoamine oxidase